MPQSEFFSYTTLATIAVLLIMTILFHHFNLWEIIISVQDRLEKQIFIYRCKKEFNQEYNLSLHFRDRLLYYIDTNLILKFTVFSAGVIILIAICKHILPLIIDWTKILYPRFTIYQPPDNNTARYFYSAVAQSLAALFAIPMSILLIYLQVSMDKYSIKTIKLIFKDNPAVSVMSTFLVTIFYSLFELCRITDIIDSNKYNNAMPYTETSSLITTFVLIIICVYVLITFFYQVISSLMPENLVQLSFEKLEKANNISLDYFQTFLIKYSFITKKIRDFNNIEIDQHIDVNRSNFEKTMYAIKPQRHGLIQEINISKLKSCSKLLNLTSVESKLILTIPNDLQIRHFSELGFIECSDNKIRNKVENLVRDSYQIKNETSDIIGNYEYLSISSLLIINMIQNSEKAVAEKALRKLSDIIIKQIYLRNKIKILLPDTIPIFINKEAVNKYFEKLDNIIETCVEKSNLQTAISVLYVNYEIGSEAIKLKEIEIFRDVTNFFYNTAYRFNERLIDNVLYWSDNLEIKIAVDIRAENDIENLNQLKKILDLIIEHYENLLKLLIDRSSPSSRTCLAKFSDINIHIEYLCLSSIENPGFNLQFEKRSKLEKELKFSLVQSLYAIGTYLMINLEKSKYEVEFSKQLFSLLTNFFEKEILEDFFNEIERANLFKIEVWTEEFEDYRAHILDSSYNDRFYILMKAFVFKKNGRLTEIKPIERFNDYQLKIFEAQVKKLSENSHIWDPFFENRSTYYFKEIFETIKKSSEKRKEILVQKIKDTKLSEEKIKKVKLEISTQTKQNSEVRNYVKVEHIKSLKEPKNIEITTYLEKIFLVDNSVDQSNVYDFLQLVLISAV